MRKTKPIWSDGVVASQVVKCVLTYWSKETRQIAGVYEQELACLPNEEDKEPRKVNELEASSLPISFLQGGSKRWCVSEQQTVIGYKIDLSSCNRVVQIREVDYRAVYNYAEDKFQRVYTEYSGRLLPFKVWHELEQLCFVRGELVKMVPLFFKPNINSCEIVNGRPCYMPDDKKAPLTPRFLGVYVYKLYGKKRELEKFEGFVASEKMEEKGLKFR